MQTRSEQPPPRNPPTVATGFEGDEAEQMGERIMQLTLKQAVELSRYLRTVHGVLPSP